jgi:hypothetical protein
MAYLLKSGCGLVLWGGIILLFLRQILAVCLPSAGALEKAVCKLTDPVMYLAGALCHAAGLTAAGQWIDCRYPVACFMLGAVNCCLETISF